MINLVEATERVKQYFKPFSWCEPIKGYPNDAGDMWIIVVGIGLIEHCYVEVEVRKASGAIEHARIIEHPILGE